MTSTITHSQIMSCSGISLVASDGTVARLTSLEPRLITDPPLPIPAPPPAATEETKADSDIGDKKRKHDETKDESETVAAGDNKKQASKPDWQALQISFAELVGMEASVATMQFL